MINSLIVDSLNKVLEFSQNKLSKLFEESLLLPKLDWLIYASILGVFFLSAFASSDSIGYLALVTLLLTVVKILLKKGDFYKTIHLTLLFLTQSPVENKRGALLPRV